MKILYDSKNPTRYFDRYGTEIHEGDTIEMNGRTYTVYRTESDELGVDATNPKWIEIGRAVPCEYGIYVFDLDDDPVVKK